MADAYRIQEIEQGPNAFGQLRLLLSIGHGSGERSRTLDFLERYVGETDQPALRYAALWAIATRFGDHPILADHLDGAASEVDARSVYTAMTAAAFLAVADAPGRQRVDRFLPRLYTLRREILADPQQIFRQGVLAWSLYQIGGPVAGQEAAKIRHWFTREMFPEDGFLLYGTDGLALIGPAAAQSVPPLVAIVDGERGVTSLLHADEAAFALMQIGTPAARAAFDRYAETLRADLHARNIGERASRIDAALDAALDLLPYSACLKPAIAALAETDLPDDIAEKARRFLASLPAADGPG